MKLLRGVHIYPATREHYPFVLDSFRCSLADLGGVASGLVDAHVGLLERQLRGGLTRAVVASPIGHPETLLGWASEAFGSLLFAYVIQDLRKRGFASELYASLFARGPVRLVYWTETAEAIREHGFPIVHDWREFARRERAAEKATVRRFQHFTERATA